MPYKLKENELTYDIYADLRTSVGWHNRCQEQAETALQNSYYTITVFDDTKAIGMGRVVGDGIYFTIVDVVVRPEYQDRKIGSTIIHSILKNIEDRMCVGSRANIQLISAVGKENFYIKQGFSIIPDPSCGSALRMIISKKQN
ncbi:MAG: GNAT family N-acetyltransferase [Bulleidia sp.]